MFKCLVVGCGEIAGGKRLTGSVTHGGAFFAHDKLALSAGIDKDPTRAKRFSSLFKCEHGTDLISALKRHQPVLVSVCTPDETHFELVYAILLSPHVPRVIFLEKPACTSKEQYEMMLRIAAERGSVIVVNHSRRFNPDINELRKRITNSEFGQLMRVRAVYYSGWMHNGTHVIDTLTFLFGDSVRIKSVNNIIESPYAGDPTLEVSAVLDRLQVPVEIIAIDDRFYQIFEFDLWFTDARLRLENFGQRIVLERRVINEIAEHVLEPVSTELPWCRKTAMEEAVDRIVGYLETQDVGLLEGYRLEDIGQTIETLFDGRRIYERDRSTAV
jgi:predicted dehydrogenase